MLLHFFLFQDDDKCIHPNLHNMNNKYIEGWLNQIYAYIKVDIFVTLYIHARYLNILTIQIPRVYIRFDTMPNVSYKLMTNNLSTPLENSLTKTFQLFIL